MTDSHYWSRYVQLTEELYHSRSLRFRPDNMHRWTEAMGLCDGMDILEVGCAGGLLCHRLQEHLPASRITGIDLDAGHISFAKHKTAELGLPCRFITADALQMPFAKDSFDACISHTVVNFCEPEGFIREQKRVLRPGGRIVLMNVVNSRPGPEEWVPTEANEEYALFDRLWEAAARNPLTDTKRYPAGPEVLMPILKRHGFGQTRVDAVSVVKYAPDYDATPPVWACMQIHEDRMSELSSAMKARRLAPDALTEVEYASLMEMINRRWAAVMDAYMRGDKRWEYRLSTVLVLSAVKEDDE